MNDETLELFIRAMATVAACVMGTVSMYITGGETGIGWATLCVFFIWN